MAETFYLSLPAVDLPALDGLAERWETIHRDIKGLGKRMHDEVLTPLRDKRYWEGAAAPYAWKMIDDIERQLENAAKVAEAARRVVEDGVADLKSAQKDLKDARGGPRRRACTSSRTGRSPRTSSATSARSS
ncbi:hypothetical protein ACFRFJ_34155 [Streptomyces hydrogenans]|uniref:hypothetical protein n=1 Tax=Streptomyces hydrogenans TaxID=1873719 RepID=UPI0036AFAD59